MRTMLLHHEMISDASANPTSWLLMTHGIMGSGGNWRGIARQVVTRRPTWGVVLVDLRGHGRSPNFEPPHTVDACAGDLVALMTALHESGKLVRALAGHSFGGKVVLATRGKPQASSVVQTFVLDSTPAALPEGRPSVDAVVAAIAGLPVDFTDRAEFEAAVMAAGQPRAVAQWLALSLAPTQVVGERRRLRFDMAMIETLMADYERLDLWSQFTGADMPGDAHLLVAENSTVVRPEVLARAREVGPRVTTHLIAGAGHWLNVDAPAAVVDIIVAALP